MPAAALSPALSGLISMHVLHGKDRGGRARRFFALECIMQKSDEKPKSPTLDGAMPWLKALAIKLGEDVVESSRWRERDHAVDFGTQVFPSGESVREWVCARPAFNEGMADLGKRFGPAKLSKWIAQDDGSEGSKLVGRQIAKAWPSLKKEAMSLMIERQRISERELMSAMARQHGLRLVRFVRS